MSVDRVLHVVGAMNRGGAETMIMSMYRALDRTRLQFDFLELQSGPSDYREEILSMGGRLIHCEWSQSPKRLVQTIRELSQTIRSEGPFRAVHSHVLFASGTVLLAAARAGVKSRVAHSHSTSMARQGLSAKVYALLARGLIRSFATNLAACSVDAGSYLFGREPFAQMGLVVPNAVDTDVFRPPIEDERVGLRVAFQLPLESMVLVSVARLESVKNHKFLVELADVLDSSGFGFDMLFIGDGSLRSALEVEVSDRGLEHRVHFWGVRDDVAEIMRCSDYLLMPSHFEGLPVALVEAQATGLVCLVSGNVTKEADMGLGLLYHYPTSDPALWADVLAHPTSLPRAVASTKRALDERGYGVSGALEKLLTLYP